MRGSEGFRLPLTFDASHWFNLAVLDVRGGKGQYKDSSSSTTLQTFIKRCNNFAEQLKWGKVFSTVEQIAKEKNIPMYAPVFFAQQR